MPKLRGLPYVAATAIVAALVNDPIHGPQARLANLIAEAVDAQGRAWKVTVVDTTLNTKWKCLNHFQPPVWEVVVLSRDGRVVAHLVVHAACLEESVSTVRLRCPQEMVQ